MAEKVLWPSWRYGPNGQSGIFQSEDDVPAGWIDNIGEALRRDQEEAESRGVNVIENNMVEGETEILFTPAVAPKKLGRPKKGAK